MLAVFLPEPIARDLLTGLRFKTPPTVRQAQELMAALEHALLECQCGKEGTRDR